MVRVATISNFWQNTESLIDKTIWALSRVSIERGISITWHMTFPLKCDVLKSLYHTEFKDTDVDKQLNKLIENHLKPAKKLRDQYAHATWLQNEKNQTLFLEKPSRSKPHIRPKIVTIDQLDSDQIKVLGASLLLLNFIAGQLDFRIFPPDIDVRGLLREYNPLDDPSSPPMIVVPRRLPKPRKPLPPPISLPE